MGVPIERGFSRLEIKPAFPGHEIVVGTSETRNSRLREKVVTPVQTITKAIHKKVPGLTPTHLNILGAAEVGIGAIIAASRDPYKKGGEKLKTPVSSILIIKGSLLDAFDGSLARLKASEDPNSVNFKKGGIYDVLSDRFQELVLALSRAGSAVKRKSKIGTMTALAAAVTNSWPSITRAFSESKGKPVPESGKGIVGLIGTRPGKAVLGGIATEFTNPKGLPVQPVIDTAITVSNIITAIHRLQTAFGQSEATLSPATRGEAKTRLKILGAVGVIAAGASLFTYWRLNRHRLQKEVKPALKDADYLQVLNTIERYCNEYGLDHRFVGGTFTDFIGPKTEAEIDIARRKVTLKKPNSAALRRSDGTIKDVDMIIYTPDRSKFLGVRKDFAEWTARETEKGIALPQISIEAARHPNWPERNSLKQFVTAWEINKWDRPHLVFGAVDQEIAPASIAPWRLDLGNGTQITVLNPVAHALCYELRVPSGVKRKDRQEIGTYDSWVIKSPYSKLDLVDKLARQTIAEGLREEVNYNFLYSDWVDYIENLSKRADILTGIKGKITGLYWNTIGTQVAHGAGIFKGFAKFGNRMTG